MRTSNCCDASGKRLMSEELEISFEDAGICSDCGEHCEYISDKIDISELSPFDRWQLEKYGNIAAKPVDIPDERVVENGFDDLNRFSEWMCYMAEQELLQYEKYDHQ